MPKPKFDPSQPFEVVGGGAKPKFDPNQPFEAVDEARPSQEDSFARGMGQGLSLGFADELYGGAKSIADDIRGVFGQGQMADGPQAQFNERGQVTNTEEINAPAIENYEKHRDGYRARDAAAREENPFAFGAGELGGGIGSAFIPGLGMVKAAQATKAGLNASRLARMGNWAKSLAPAAAQGAGIGAVSGAGYSESDDMQGVLSDAAAGAAIGTAAPYALSSAGKAIKAGFNATQGAGKTLLSTVGGVKRDVIDRYLQNPDRIRNAPTLDDIFDEVTPVVNKLADDLDSKTIDYDDAKKALSEVSKNIRESRVKKKEQALEKVRNAQMMLDEVFTEEKRSLAKEADPRRLEPLVKDALGTLKTKVVEGVEAAEDVLSTSGKSIKNASLMKPLKKIAKELDEDFSDEATKAKGKIQKYIGILSERGEEIDLKDARRFMKNIRNDIKTWEAETGTFDGDFPLTLKRAQGEFDKRIKQASPEYEKAMLPAAEDTRLLGKAAEAFSKDKNRYSKLERVGKPSAKYERETLEQLGRRVGGELPEATEKVLQAQRTLKSPTRLEAIKQNLPEASKLKEAERALRIAKGATESSKVREAIANSLAFERSKSAKARMKQAKAVFAKFKSFGEERAETRIQAVAQGKIRATRTLKELSELADKDFVKMVDAWSDASAFEKSAFNGSRNVNLWTVLGTVTWGGAKGSAIGGVLGGPVGMAIGASIGATLDVYGPKITKKILDQVVKAKRLNEKAIQKFDLPENVKSDLIQGFRNTITNKQASGARASSRAVADEREKNKRKPAEDL